MTRSFTPDLLVRQDARREVVSQEGAAGLVSRQLEKKLRGHTFLNRCLLIFRALIFESRVDCGIPSLAAAPRGPDTLPLHSASAASIISFSWVASFSERG